MTASEYVNEDERERIQEAEDEANVVERSPLADRPDLLTAAANEVRRLGVHGEDTVVRLVYLSAMSRLLDKPVNTVVKGPSSGGKSFVTEKTLSLFPSEAIFAMTAMSDRALVYLDKSVSLRRRVVVIYEAQGFASDIGSYIVRSLLSEGRISYPTVQKTKDGLKTVIIEQEGPTGLITTTTEVHLHPENETRMVSVLVTDDAGQTKAVMHRMAEGVADPSPDARFIEHQRWLAWVTEQQRREHPDAPMVVVPFAVELAELVIPVAVRLRRDFATLLSLVSAHALLHLGTRERNEDGSVLATHEDYVAVEAFFSDLVADAVERAVPATVRETVEVVRRLTTTGTPTTVTTVAEVLKVDKSSASRRLSTAAEAGYCQNDEDRPGRAAKWRLGDVPMPTDMRVLPTPEDLLRRCSRNEGDRGEPLQATVAAAPERPENGSIHAQTSSPGGYPLDTPTTPQHPVAPPLHEDSATVEDEDEVGAIVADLDDVLGISR